MLEPGGVVCVAVVHPINSAGRFEKHGRFVIYSLHPTVFASGPRGALVDLGWCRLEFPHDALPADVDDAGEEPEPVIKSMGKKAGKK